MSLFESGRQSLAPEHAREKIVYETKKRICPSTIHRFLSSNER